MKKSFKYYNIKNESNIVDALKLQDAESLEIETITLSKFLKTKRNGSPLQFASDRLKNDKEIVLEAVKANGYALQFASDELKSDKEIVLKAVKESGYALKYASDELKNDIEIVLEAVKENGYALKYASDELKANIPFLLDLVARNSIYPGQYIEYLIEYINPDIENYL